MAYKDKSKAIEKQNQWIAEKCDRINLTVPIGDKAIIKAHADLMGESVNAFIKRSIALTMASDLQKLDIAKKETE